MSRVYLSLVITILFLIQSCKKPETDNVRIPSPLKTDQGSIQTDLTSEEYYDKVFGAIVGSAIGDAMGATTEMMTKEKIRRDYGYITGLTQVDIGKSAEGPWQHQMDSGSTTDDTRWKYFTGKYFSKHAQDLSAENFIQFIIDYYQEETKGLSDERILNAPDLLDERMQKVNWIKEWARVGIAFQQGPSEFVDARSRFYGGEMTCAGMLYTPMFGLIAPDSRSAYIAGYEHSLFDIGYARDISGLVAAMTQAAMQLDSIDDILKTSLSIDPYGYADSRLVGRLTYKITLESREIINKSLELDEKDTVEIKVPKYYPGTKTDWLRQDFIYCELDKKKKAIAFHAGEIWQILYTALLFGQGDFEKTMAFIVNYGRDNDTVGAVAGMVLGAQIGYSGLPRQLKEKTLSVSKEIIGIDLETIAKEIVDNQFILKE